MAIVLAAAVGVSGHVLAVDKAPGSYGYPKTLEQAHTIIKASTFGSRISFVTSANLLDGRFAFSGDAFDMAIFSNSSWYMSSIEEMGSLFHRVRMWSKRLGYAEWDLRVKSLRQVPHLLAVILQQYIQSIYRMERGYQLQDSNIRTLIFPRDARAIAEQAGWSILNEATMSTSTSLRLGGVSETRKALAVAAEFAQQQDMNKDLKAFATIQRDILKEIRKKNDRSLGTYMFLAQRSDLTSEHR
jgi:hypothetical protein